MRPVDVKRKEGGEEVLDEAFLRRVDRAMLISKQVDPDRLEEAWRAVVEESRLANTTDAYGLERRRTRGGGPHWKGPHHGVGHFFTNGLRGEVPRAAGLFLVRASDAAIASAKVMVYAMPDGGERLQPRVRGNCSGPRHGWRVRRTLA